MYILPGNAGDSLNYHNGMKFTTKDRANDKSGGNCAASLQGAWWYKGCHHSHLNGVYLGSTSRSWKGINWLHWKNDNRSMKKTEMKIRPALF